MLEADNSGVTIKDTTVPSLVLEVKKWQHEDPSLEHLKAKSQDQQFLPFDIVVDGVLRCSGQLCVPDVAGLRHKIMNEAHHSCYLMLIVTNTNIWYECLRSSIV